MNGGLAHSARSSMPIDQWENNNYLLYPCFMYRQKFIYYPYYYAVSSQNVGSLVRYAQFSLGSTVRRVAENVAENG
jgi:hypothetical protein